MCPSQTAFLGQEMHFSAGKFFFLSTGKGIFFQESALLNVNEASFCRKVHYSAVGSAGLRIMNGSLFLHDSCLKTLRGDLALISCMLRGGQALKNRPRVC